nr:MAG TPA: hypothetical protein [Crassvirales sp.]
MTKRRITDGFPEIFEICGRSSCQIGVQRLLYLTNLPTQQLRFRLSSKIRCYWKLYHFV